MTLTFSDEVAEFLAAQRLHWLMMKYSSSIRKTQVWLKAIHLATQRGFIIYIVGSFPISLIKQFPTYLIEQSNPTPSYCPGSAGILSLVISLLVKLLRKTTYTRLNGLAAFLCTECNWSISPGLPNKLLHLYKLLYIGLITRFKHLLNISAKGKMKGVYLPQRADFSSFLCLKGMSLWFMRPGKGRKKLIELQLANMPGEYCSIFFCTRWM